jgi:hypothetical protein
MQWEKTRDELVFTAIAITSIILLLVADGVFIFTVSVFSCIRDENVWADKCSKIYKLDGRNRLITALSTAYV